MAPQTTQVNTNPHEYFINLIIVYSGEIRMIAIKENQISCYVQ